VADPVDQGHRTGGAAAPALEAEREVDKGEPVVDDLVEVGEVLVVGDVLLPAFEEGDVFGSPVVEAMATAQSTASAAEPKTARTPSPRVLISSPPVRSMAPAGR
jgi:hypothetical protein